MAQPTRTEGGMGFDFSFHDGHAEAVLVAKYRQEIAAGKVARAQARREVPWQRIRLRK